MSKNTSGKPAAKKTSKLASEGGASSKKGFLIGVIALVAILVGAGIAYSALAPEDAGSIKGASSAASSAASSNGTAQGSASASSSQQASSDAEATVVEAPNITITDSAGEQVSLSDFRGKPIVLNFWASTCGPCQSEMPGFQTAYETYGDDVAFLMVNIPGFLGETKDKATAYLEKNQYTLPVYFDSLKEADVAYGLASIPRTFLIDAQGYVVASQVGVVNSASLNNAIKNMLL